MTADKSALDQALDRGSHDELPPPIPPGFMGEKSPDMRREESFAPSLNAGLIQESTWETKWLTIGLLYALLITRRWPAGCCGESRGARWEPR